MTPAQYRLLRNLANGADAWRGLTRGFELCAASAKHRGWVTYQGGADGSPVRNVQLTQEGRAALEKQSWLGITVVSL